MVRTVIELIAGVRARYGVKLFRFGAVSTFNVVFGQLLLYIAQVDFDIDPLRANTISVCVGAVPAYFLSRYWVWEKRGKNHMMREVVPFWTLTLLGFALSTVAVWYVDHNFNATVLAVNLTNLGSFGVGWVAKFVILDRMLFKPEQAPAV